MSYVIYNIHSTYIEGNEHGYATERAAKAALTRLINDGKLFGKADFAVAERGKFFNEIEEQVVKINLMSRKEFTIGINAPACVDPSTETYWSM
jgi:hypothetical protein